VLFNILIRGHLGILLGLNVSFSEHSEKCATFKNPNLVLELKPLKILICLENMTPIIFKF
jgi:hypothetical protein